MIDHTLHADIHVEQTSQNALAHSHRASLPEAKGSCWYCEQAVDNVRRFCSVSCRNDYFEEENESC